ncbi:MAG: hypothetical protein KF817_07370 [Phycisphaeraceae bacterium]|nr:hypothetical protein [Phycisphaeraceae bacterium]
MIFRTRTAAALMVTALVSCGPAQPGRHAHDDGPRDAGRDSLVVLGGPLPGGERRLEIIPARDTPPPRSQMSIRVGAEPLLTLADVQSVRHMTVQIDDPPDGGPVTRDVIMLMLRPEARERLATVAAPLDQAPTPLLVLWNGRLISCYSVSRGFGLHRREEIPVGLTEGDDPQDLLRELRTAIGGLAAAGAADR